MLICTSNYAFYFPYVNAYGFALNHLRIVRTNGNLAIIRFADGCGTQLPLKRLYSTQEDAYEELSHNDTLSRIQVEYDTENRRKWNGHCKSSLRLNCSIVLSPFDFQESPFCLH